MSKTRVRELLNKHMIPDLSNIVISYLDHSVKEFDLENISEEMVKIISQDKFGEKVIFTIIWCVGIKEDDFYPKIYVKTCKYVDRYNYYSITILKNERDKWELEEEATYDIHHEDTHERYKELESFIYNG